MSAAPILITGGAGFIGQALCRALLSDGAQVRIVDDLSTGSLEGIPEGAEFVEGDVRDLDLMREAAKDVQAIVHLAALSSVEQCTRERTRSRLINLSGTLNTLEASGGRPVVLASSAAVYGAQNSLPIPEHALPAPLSAYAVDKLASERALCQYSRRSGAAAIALRLFNVYGPGQSPHSPYAGVVARFLDLARQGEPIWINGAGTQTRDFVHIDTVVDALISALRVCTTPSEEPFRTLNVCTGKGTSIKELAETANAIFGGESTVGHRPARRGDIEASVGCPDLTRSILGPTLQIALRDALEEMVRPRTTLTQRAPERAFG